MKKFALVIAAFALLSIQPVHAQHTPSPEAKAAYDAAHKLPFGDPKQVEMYGKVIALDPDYLDAQQSYTMAYFMSKSLKTGTNAEKEATIKKVRAELQAEYMKLAAEHPDKAVYPWVLGWLCDYENPDKSVGYYEQALKIDPKFGPAYDMLAIAAEEQGDIKKEIELEAKGHEVWPNDPKIWRHYLGAYTSQIDPAGLDKALEIAKELAAKFPEEGVSMLGYTAGRVVDPVKRRALYEQILAQYPKQAGGYTMEPLFAIDIGTDPKAALALADKLRKAPQADSSEESPAKLWDPMYDYAKGIVDAQALIAEGKGAEATALLAKVKVAPARGDGHPLELARARALALQGKNQEAYSTLEKDFATKPSDETYPTLLALGSKLGKGKQDVDADVEVERTKQSKDGIPFTLTDLATGKPVSLADYKGRVVLVNFWYPKCGPCRGEFPYLQMALQKYKDRGFAILAINGHPPEDSWVMPLIRGWGLGFTPLKSTEDVIKRYNVYGYPSNFLYGADGRIYPMPFQIRADTMDEFDLQVEGLMAQAAKSSASAAMAAPKPAAGQ